MVKGLDRVPTLSKEQLKLMSRLQKGLYGSKFDITKSPQYAQSLADLSQAGQYYKGLMDPSSEAYEKFKAPMMTEFQQQIIPGISERFAGMGAQSSSAFGQQLGAAGAGLEERLAALRTGLQQEGARGLQDVSQQQFSIGATPYQMALDRARMALNTPEFAYYQKPQKGASGMESFAGGFFPGFGKGLAGWIASKIFG